MRSPRFTVLAAGLACVLTAMSAAAQAPAAPAAPAVRDGSHDFDWMAGTWKAHLKRLENPLTGSTKWVELDGTQRTWLAWGGRSAMDEFTVEDPVTKTRIDALTVRLYDKAHDQWSIYWANATNGAFSLPPTVGRWTNGRGEFYDHEEIGGRWILVRYVWSDVTPTSAHFEQAFSIDGGKTWEANWISDITRRKDAGSQ
jgi:hypothetical protein